MTLATISSRQVHFSLMTQPLADQLRPKQLSDIYGQEHILSPSGLLQSSIRNKKPLSLILWGPPGSGKTSIARLYGQAFSLKFHSFNAVFSGVADLRRILKEEPFFAHGFLLFVDEIHRFTKAQQDAFLPFIENGTIVLVGATAENPSFYLNSALLSRVRVLKLKSLEKQALHEIVARCERLQGPLPLEDEAKELLCELAQGDGRFLLNLIESLASVHPQKPLNSQELQALVERRPALGDKAGDQHYNLISALHKSIRGSDPDASLYWYARMLEAGQDPLFVARRVIRMAVEDVGLADPHALAVAVQARDAYQMLGSPEGELAVAEAIVYIALAPKSNAVYTAFGQARAMAAKTGHMDPPAHILQAPTKLMKEHGYGKGYSYDHETKNGFSGQNYFPAGMERQVFYEPVERGFEREMKKRIEYFTALRKK